MGQAQCCSGQSVEIPSHTNKPLERQNSNFNPGYSGLRSVKSTGKLSVSFEQTGRESVCVPSVSSQGNRSSKTRESKASGRRDLQSRTSEAVGGNIRAGEVESVAAQKSRDFSYNKRDSNENYLTAAQFKQNLKDINTFTAQKDRPLKDTHGKAEQQSRRSTDLQRTNAYKIQKPTEKHSQTVQGFESSREVNAFIEERIRETRKIHLSASRPKHYIQEQNSSTAKQRRDFKETVSGPFQAGRELRINEPVTVKNRDPKILPSVTAKKEQDSRLIQPPKEAKKEVFFSFAEPVSARSDMASLHPEVIRQQYTECPSCSKEYNDFLQIPRVLPCLHAICISCLESTASRGTVKCPSCDIRHNVPNGDIEQFRADETRLFLANKNRLQERNPEISCQECNSKTRSAKYRCKECAQFLCADCYDAHKRTKVTKRHHVLGLEELREAPLDDFQQVHYCNVSGHEEQPYVFFCMSETCDRPVCALCAVAEHQESKGHDVREIHEVHGDVKRSIEGLMSDVKHRTLSAQDTSSAIDNTVESLEANLQVTVVNIDATFDNAVKALERRRTELKDKAHARAKDKKKRLENQLDSINFHINSMEDANEFSGNITMYGSQSELLFFKDTIVERLNFLRDEEFDTIPHDNDELKFKPKKMGEDFNKHVRDLGEIWTTSAYGPNTHVEAHDVIKDREQTILDITLFDSEGLQQSEGGADLRVDVIDPSGRRRGATVVDNTGGDGRYKAIFLGTTKGKHRATVYLHGTPMPNDHVFRVATPSSVHVDRLNLTDKAVSHTMRPMRTATPSEMSQDMSPITDHMLGDVICPGFVFDATTSSSSVEILEDGKTMRARSNKGNTTRRTGREQGRFAIYRGAMATRPIQKSGLYYFEVGVVYKVAKLIRQEHVFEIGLSKLDCIDRHPSVDCHPYAWCVSARGCHVCGKVCLQAWHNGQLLSHTAISARTKSPPGTFIRLYYGFLLDAEKRHWIVTDVKNKKPIFRFKNLVVSEMSEPLWPVFSVSSPEVVSAVMTLKAGRAIDMVPEEALESLVP